MSTVANGPGAKLRALRAAKGLSQLGVAAKAHCSVSALVGIERWSYVPTGPTRRKIARALGTTPVAIWPDIEGTSTDSASVTNVAAAAGDGR